MTQEQYNKSIETGELQLDAWGKFSYFSIVVVLFAMPIACMALDIFDKSTNFVRPPIGFIIVPTIFGILFYILQKSRLKFTIVKTRLSKNEFLKLIKQISDKFKLTTIFEGEDVFVAKTNTEYFSSIIRKQITILRNNDEVMINCIFDLNRKGPVDIMGQNKKAVNTLIEMIERFEKEVGH